MNFNEYKYEAIEDFEDGKQTGDVKIRKSGLTAEFTMNDIDRDIQLLEKKKLELDSQIKIEDAKMQNIDRTNPEVGQMSPEMRQVVYIYERAYAFCKVGKEKVEEIDKMIADYKHELMDIALQTGILTTKTDEQGSN
jgi:hypothetical protein